MKNLSISVDHIAMHEVLDIKVTQLFLTTPFTQIKQASAQGEEAWKGAGTKVGLQVWRIVKFKVTILTATTRVLLNYPSIQHSCVHCSQRPTMK